MFVRGPNCCWLDLAIFFLLLFNSIKTFFHFIVVLINNTVNVRYGLVQLEKSQKKLNLYEMKICLYELWVYKN